MRHGAMSSYLKYHVSLMCCISRKLVMENNTEKLNDEPKSVVARNGGLICWRETVNVNFFFREFQELLYLCGK